MKAFTCLCVVAVLMVGAPIASAKEAFPWKYRAETDAMTGVITTYASTVSTNVIQLAFPYNGGTRARLFVRQTAEAQPEFMIELTKGQFLCQGIEYCKVVIKFDDGEPMDYGGTRSEDGALDVLFLRSETLLIQRLPDAKRMRVEALIFQEGRRVFEFNVQGLAFPLNAAAQRAKPRP